MSHQLLQLPLLPHRVIANEAGDADAVLLHRPAQNPDDDTGDDVAVAPLAPLDQIAQTSPLL